MRIFTEIVFVALAAFFLLSDRLGCDLARVPIPPRVRVTRADLHLGPPRSRLHDPPMYDNGGELQRCSHCHDLFESPPDGRRELLQHKDVVLRHGLNDNCYNCHRREDRDFLVLRDGRAIGFDDVLLLCAQCHGPTYRDWTRGMHGRTDGAWDPETGLQKRLVCTDCHDPHAPAYDPVVPLPGPHTLRMGEPIHPDELEEARKNPLERWKLKLAPGNEFHEERR